MPFKKYGPKEVDDKFVNIVVFGITLIVTVVSIMWLVAPYIFPSGH